MVQMLRALGTRNLIPEKLQGFLDTLNLIEDCREDRNFLAHGTWLLLKPESHRIAMSLKPDAPPGDVISESFNADRMHQIAKSMEDCRISLVLLMNEIETSRDKLLTQHPKD
jgi:hypothetical protein